MTLYHYLQIGAVFSLIAVILSVTVMKLRTMEVVINGVCSGLLWPLVVIVVIYDLVRIGCYRIDKWRGLRA